MKIGWWVGLAFAICCAWRLARFNIQGMAPGGGSRVLRRFAVPAAAGLLVVGFTRSKFPSRTGRWFGRVDGSGDGRGGVMASTVRFRSFKDIPGRGGQPSVLIVPSLCWFPYSFFGIHTRIDRDVLRSIGLALHIVRCPHHRFPIPP